ncbi:MAG: hypothetical protein U0234_20860 [Sandaracinus sp.]
MRHAGALVLLLAACEAPPPPPAMPDAAAASLDQATTDRVEGTIAGEAFAALDVRFRARDGAVPRIDLWLADAAIERCGLALPRSGTRVWLRFPGVTTLARGRYAQTDEPSSPLTAHYERFVGRHGAEPDWAEVHRARAEVEITRASATAIEGRLRACFADSEQSCVGGRFVARPCYSRVDGRALREPPGLVDEALEPRSPR